MKEITTIEVQQRLERGEHLNIVDVREQDEVANGTIPSAVHIPLGEIPDRLNEFNQAKSYIIICRSGARSGRVTEFLTAEGIEAANMVGGMLEWGGEIE